VLEPGTPYAIRGFYVKGKLFDFIAKPAADVAVTELGQNSDRHGRIDFDIFVEPASVASGTTVDKTSKPEFSFRTVNTRGTSFSQLKKQVKESLVPDKQAIARTFITKNMTGRDQVLQSTAFDGRHLGGLSINYRRPEGPGSPSAMDP
jgi:hypothetical protein